MRRIALTLSTFLTAAAVAPAAHAASSPATQPAPAPKNLFTRGLLHVTPQGGTPQAGSPSKPTTGRLRGVLMAVLNDSIVIERAMSPTLIRQWSQSGTVPSGFSGFQNLATIAIAEDRVYERIYFDTGTLTAVEEMKRSLFQDVFVEARFDSSGRKYVLRVKAI